jgi:hypothetical protein
VGFVLHATSKRKLFNKEKRKEKPAETGKRKEKRKQGNKAGGGAGKVFESKIRPGVWRFLFKTRRA